MAVDKEDVKKEEKNPKKVEMTPGAALVWFLVLLIPAAFAVGFEIRFIVEMFELGWEFIPWDK